MGQDGGDPVPLPLEDTLDLHTFPPRDVPEIVEEYLRAARDAGLDEVRVIHGRGRGVQRARVLALLSSLSFVTAFSEAPPDRGGWGATIVRLDVGGSTGT